MRNKAFINYFIKFIMNRGILIGLGAGATTALQVLSVKQLFQLFITENIVFINKI